MKVKKEGAVEINFVLRRDDVPPVEEIREEMFREAEAGNIKRAATLFDMLIVATILEQKLKDVPRIEDMEIKGTVTV